MAYILEIRTICSTGGCARRATHEVFNAQNGRMGKYCRKCAQTRLASLQRTEDIQNERARQRAADHTEG